MLCLSLEVSLYLVTCQALGLRPKEINRDTSLFILDRKFTPNSGKYVAAKTRVPEFGVLRRSPSRSWQNLAVMTGYWKLISKRPLKLTQSWRALLVSKKERSGSIASA